MLTPTQRLNRRGVKRVVLDLVPSALQRAADLAARMPASVSPDLQAIRLTRSVVLRMAVLRGLADLEREHPAPGAADELAKGNP